MFPDGRRVVSGSMDETFKVWDVATGKCVATLGHSGFVRCAASPFCSSFVMMLVVGLLYVCCRVSGRAARRFL